jgi:hypothetical protein
MPGPKTWAPAFAGDAEGCEPSRAHSIAIPAWLARSPGAVRAFALHACEVSAHLREDGAAEFGEVAAVAGHCGRARAGAVALASGVRAIAVEIEDARDREAVVVLGLAFAVAGFGGRRLPALSHAR